MTVSKEQDASVETKKELLTIAEMKTRGFSEYLAAIIADVFLFGFNPKKTTFSCLCRGEIFLWLHPFILRCKIQAIISRNTPVPDPDAPECAQSVRFWCTSGGQATERERTRVSAQARANVATTAEGLDSLLGTTDVGPMLGAEQRVVRLATVPR